MQIFGQNIGINETGSDPDGSSGLDINFTDKGLLIPRMTTTQRNTITAANSLLIYNTTTDCFEAYYSGTTSWISLFCLGCQLPGMFSSTAATNETTTDFDANWIASAGATTYFLDVDDNADFSSPLAGFNNLDVGNVTTYSVTGLTCNTAYYYRLRANNSCGTTVNSNTTTVTTGACCTASTPVVTVVSNGKTWMDRNLGASQVATSSTDALSYGDQYQWGRCADGHQITSSGTTSTNSTTDDPGHGNYILEPNAPGDWRTPPNDNLWQGGAGINNPCPSGYRLPTQAEQEAERLSWSSNNAAGAFASPLKLPMAGYRRRSDGALIGQGTRGDYWNSTPVPASPIAYLTFGASHANTVNTSSRATGQPIRCIQN